MTKVNKAAVIQKFLFIPIGYSRQKRRKGKNKGLHPPKAGSDNKHSKEDDPMTSGHKTSLSAVEDEKKKNSTWAVKWV